jgi:AraC-like DNA-binding protein
MPADQDAADGIPPVGSVYRSAGLVGANEYRNSSLIGIGVVDKSGRQGDAVDQVPGHYSALYVLRGRARYHDDRGCEARAGAGSLIQRLPDRRHTLVLDAASGFVECFIACPPQFATELMTLGIIDRQRPVVAPGLDAAIVAELMRCRERLRSVSEAALPAMTARILGILTDLLTRELPVPGSDRDHDLVAAACQVLAGAVDERRTLAHLLRASGVSYERFRKIFRARTGIPPGEYRIRQRIDRARGLLADPTLTLEEIARQLGYANAFVLSAQFKRVLGVPPAHYRLRR